MFKIPVGMLSILGIVVIISGCGAPRPKVAMTDSEYENFATRWAGFDICGAEGKMDPSLAALGKKNTRYDMYRRDYQLSEIQMNQQIRIAGTRIKPASSEMCNRLAVDAAGERDTYERNMRANQIDEQQQQRNRQTTTNCRTNYGYTSCTTF